MPPVDRKLEWFFDVVSPFAYLQLEQLGDQIDVDRIAFRPVVLGALLRHWNTRGPAEIPLKRVQTYRSALEKAQALGIPLRFPPAHPFNPIPLLRLTVGLGATHDVVREVMRFVWQQGGDASDSGQWAELAERLGCSNSMELISKAEVKSNLRYMTEHAIERGVFGVPTLVVENEYFWGEDATSMAIKTYAEGTDWIRRGEWARVADLPVGVERIR